MIALTLDVATPADQVLLAGLPYVQKILDELDDGVLLIGGLATTAWLHASPVEFPIRATRDVDLGIDRVALGLTNRSRRIQSLLAAHRFERHPDGEPFRFTRQTHVGVFLLDLLLPKGASREDPPLIEADLGSLAVPGLAYALHRGAIRLDLTFSVDGRQDTFHLPVATLDAMLVMKATLVGDGARMWPNRRITDTADAVMLATACTHSPSALEALGANRGRSEARRAIRWLREAFSDEQSTASRRIEQHFEHEYAQAGGAAWAVAVIAEFLVALDAAS